MMSLVPCLDDNSLVNGDYINLLPICEERYNKKTKKCLAYYEKLSKEKATGFFTCPYGFSSCVHETIVGKRIYTGFRIEGSYKKGLIKCPSKSIYNPILSKEKARALIDASETIATQNRTLNNNEAMFGSFTHEIKKLNAQIKEHSEFILQAFSLIDESIDLTQAEIQIIASRVKTIFLSSSMINSRFSLLDYERNPDILTQGSLFDCGVYRKFDKISQIFKNYKQKGIPINIYGTSYAQIRAYPSFELIPLLIIENAVKYSLNREHPIDITFTETEKELTIVVKSYSPYCPPDEIGHIFTKGFRGNNAKKVSSDGQGLGLYFVSLLCGIHGIKILASSDYASINYVDGIPYAPFRVTLKFNSVFYNQSIMDN